MFRARFPLASHFQDAKSFLLSCNYLHISIRTVIMPLQTVHFNSKYCCCSSHLCNPWEACFKCSPVSHLNQALVSDCSHSCFSVHKSRTSFHHFVAWWPLSLQELGLSLWAREVHGGQICLDLIHWTSPRSGKKSLQESGASISEKQLRAQLQASAACIHGSWILKSIQDCEHASFSEQLLAQNLPPVLWTGSQGAVLAFLQSLLVGPF